ncbi:caltractin [Canna indica]|uniref:Caltractin n=1 Tax=Canna indica TaxID=4628 RepID=A0AAQ3K7Y9_9LILI|nr:caltractin [Canna indica]
MGSRKSNPRARSHGLNQQSRQEIEEVFSASDTYQSGGLDWKQLHDAVRALGFERTDEEFDSLMAEIEEGNSGANDFHKFLNMMIVKFEERHNHQEELMKAFLIIDHDNNGKISISDIQQTANEVGEIFSLDEITGMIEAADMDGDGEVDAEEFMRIMRRTSYDRFSPMTGIGSASRREEASVQLWLHRSPCCPNGSRLRTVYQGGT